MSLELGVVRSLENQRILVSERNMDKQGQVQERYYVVPEKNSDKFMKSLKSAQFANSFQKNLSLGLVPAAGIYTAIISKGSKLGRLGIGLVTSLLTYFATKSFDSFADKSTRSANMRRYKVEEVTGQDLNKIQ